MRRLTSNEAATVQTARRSQRVRLAIVLAESSYGEMADRIGVSRAHLASAAQGRQRLSLPAKVRLARVLGVPASVIWPELATLALELLHGPKGGR